jgi:DNA-binding protein YbaB
MEHRDNILNEQTKIYISNAKEKFSKMNDSLESEIIIVEDDNKYIKIKINGKQQILSINISDILFNTKNKKEVIVYLTREINHAIQKSKILSIEKLGNLFSPNEYSEIVSKEQEAIKGSITKVEKDMNELVQGLLYRQKSAPSKSGKILITITGAGIMQSLEISDEYLSMKNKDNIEIEISETLNTLTRDNLIFINEVIENIGKEFDKNIVNK